MLFAGAEAPSASLPSWAQPPAPTTRGTKSAAQAGVSVAVDADLLARQKKEEAEEKARIAAEIKAAMSGLDAETLRRLDQEKAAAERAAEEAAAKAGQSKKTANNPFAAAPAQAPAAVPQPLVTGAKKPKKAAAAVAPAAAPAAAAPQPLVSGGKPKTKLQKEAAKLRDSAAAREAAEVRSKEKREERRVRNKDRCCGVIPWQGCVGCLVLGVLASVVGTIHLSTDNYSGFAIACCLDAVFNIGAFMFLFGPRKYFRGAFVNGWKRMLAALLYWTLIALTVTLAFIPGVTKWELLAALVAMKIAWAVNLAAACGCLGKKGASEEAEKGQREAKNAAVKYVVTKRVNNKEWNI